MEEAQRTFWVAIAEDNSIPRPEPDEEGGFLPMYYNGSPVLVSTDEGADAIGVFSSEGEVISYLRQAEQEGLIGDAKAFPLSGRDDFRELFARWPVPYVVVDPEAEPVVGQLRAMRYAAVTVEEFLDSLDD